MMDEKMATLLESLHQATQRLEQAVAVKESDPDDWLAILDEREELIHQMQERFSAGSVLTEAQRIQLTQIYEVNQRLIPLIEGCKQGVQQQLNNLHRSKLAMNSYNEAGPNGYGAFFDRKK